MPTHYRALHVQRYANLTTLSILCVFIVEVLTLRGQVAERKRWGIGVAEPVAMSEKSEFLENGLLEHSSSRVRKEGARLGGASGIRSVNRKVSDDVACDLVTLIQYLLAILILMCGSMAQSNRQSFC
jgi:hypothetical protein